MDLSETMEFEKITGPSNKPKSRVKYAVTSKLCIEESGSMARTGVIIGVMKGKQNSKSNLRFFLIISILSQNTTQNRLQSNNLSI
jgi:hypothetical protein